MNAQQIRERLRDKLVDDLFFGEPGTIGDDEDLFALGLDSMGITRLVVFIERSLGAPIPDRELVAEQLRTLDALVALVQRHR